MRRSPDPAPGPGLVTGPPRCFATRGAALTPGPWTSVSSPGLAHACVHLSMQIGLRARGEGLARSLAGFGSLGFVSRFSKPREARGARGASGDARGRGRERASDPSAPTAGRGRGGAPGVGRRPARAPERRPGGSSRERPGAGSAALGRPGTLAEWGARRRCSPQNPRRRSAFLTPCEGLSFSRECQCEMMSFSPQT